MHGHQMTIGHEAIDFVGLDTVVAETVQDHQQMVTEVVELGQIYIFEHIPHRHAVKPKPCREFGKCMHVVRPGNDVDPDP